MAAKGRLISKMGPLGRTTLATYVPGVASSTGLIYPLSPPKSSSLCHIFVPSADAMSELRIGCRERRSMECLVSRRAGLEGRRPLLAPSLQKGFVSVGSLHTTQLSSAYGGTLTMDRPIRFTLISTNLASVFCPSCFRIASLYDAP